VLTKKVGDPYVGPDDWIKLAPSHEGSWWSEWTRFLAAHSGQSVAPPSLGSAEQKDASLNDAPGSYVLER
jgi:polyhydroxyalkanoate synthase